MIHVVSKIEFRKGLAWKRDGDREEGVPNLSSKREPQ